jgi:hypothetical protein
VNRGLLAGPPNEEKSLSRPDRRSQRRRAAVDSHARAQAREALVSELSRHLQGALAQTFLRIGSDPGDAAALTIARGAAPLAPARLAAGEEGSEAERQARQALYERCLAHYRTVVRPQDVDVDDVGAAAADFVVACFAALHGTRPTPEARHRLQRQLVAIVRWGPAWSKAAAADRQLCFEQLAVLAVLFAGVVANARTQPEALARARSGARTYLQRLLGLDPDTLSIGPTGLAVARERQAA